MVLLAFADARIQGTRYFTEIADVAPKRNAVYKAHKTFREKIGNYTNLNGADKLSERPLRVSRTAFAGAEAADQTRADLDLLSAFVSLASQNSLKTLQELGNFSKTTFGRLDRAFGPLPRGFPPGKSSLHSL
jgi:hypothetical protein